MATYVKVIGYNGQRRFGMIASETVERFNICKIGGLKREERIIQAKRLGI
jgi:hypothetical protein